jgi:hypothetical protein
MGEICTKYKGKTFCHSTGEGGGGPIWTTRPTGWEPKSQNADSGEPGLYPALLSDFSVISFVHGVADNIVDPKVRDAIKKGAEDAASVLKERGGADVLSVSFEEHQHRRSA